MLYEHPTSPGGQVVLHAQNPLIAAEPHRGIQASTSLTVVAETI
jgi:hypothetical protein